MTDYLSSQRPLELIAILLADAVASGALASDADVIAAYNDWQVLTDADPYSGSPPSYADFVDAGAAPQKLDTPSGGTAFSDWLASVS